MTCARVSCLIPPMRPQCNDFWTGHRARATRAPARSLAVGSASSDRANSRGGTAMDLICAKWWEAVCSTLTLIKSAERRAPSAERRAPSAERRAPSAERRAPSAERRAPSAERRAPSAERRAPSAERRAPSAERRAPTAERRPAGPAAPRRAFESERRAPSPHPPPRRAPGGGSDPHAATAAACRGGLRIWRGTGSSAPPARSPPRRCSRSPAPLPCRPPPRRDRVLVSNIGQTSDATATVGIWRPE